MVLAGFGMDVAAPDWYNRLLDVVAIVVLVSIVVLAVRRYFVERESMTHALESGIILGLIALLMLGLLLFGMVTSRQEEVRVQISEQTMQTSELPENVFAALGKNLFFYSISALQTFWFLSLFHLFFRIRLHFMRLRPKLAVSAFLLVLVPLFLVTVMGLLTLYGTLGECRAIRASNILVDWAEQARRDTRNARVGVIKRSTKRRYRAAIIQRSARPARELAVLADRIGLAMHPAPAPADAQRADDHLAGEGAGAAHRVENLPGADGVGRAGLNGNRPAGRFDAESGGRRCQHGRGGQGRDSSQGHHSSFPPSACAAALRISGSSSSSASTST